MVIVHVQYLKSSNLKSEIFEGFQMIILHMEPERFEVEPPTRVGQEGFQLQSLNFQIQACQFLRVGSEGYGPVVRTQKRTQNLLPKPGAKRAIQEPSNVNPKLEPHEHWRHHQIQGEL